MLLLVRSRGVVFTAFITSTLRITVQGIVMMLMMIMIIESAIDGTYLSLLVMFVKLANEKFTMSNWNLSAR